MTNQPKATSEKIRLGVLLSGRGSNFTAIANAIDSGKLNEAEIAVVISNNPDAGGLDTAQDKNIPTQVVKSKDDKTILAHLKEHHVDLVILAGYNRIIFDTLLYAFPNRILNIHPSLLPAYGGKCMIGMRVHQAVIAAGEKESGCTVHVVTANVDEGPILGQAKVTVAPDDTPETLADKVLAQEHQLYWQVIQNWIKENQVQAINSPVTDSDSKEQKSIHA